MIGLVGTFVVFIAGGLVWMRHSSTPRKEKWAFVVIAGIGFILWASIILQHPLDLNKAIGWIIDTLL